MENKHCEFNYYVVQFLMDHECFKKYLYRYGHDSSPTCSNCVEEEDVELIRTCCPRFRSPRETSLGPNLVMEEDFMETIQPENGRGYDGTLKVGGTKEKFNLT